MGCDKALAGPFQSRKISIHAPAWGATFAHPPGRIGRRNFNPRTRMGCDQAFLPFVHPYAHISIHAPAWGATTPASSILAMYSSFQSTHPHGVRPFLGRHTQRPDRFQSTHPHGVRPLIRWRSEKRHVNFNPRTRMGCDS